MKTPWNHEVRSMYFIGIAGIGMSALAQHFHQRGIRVAGYDADKSAVAQQLKDMGIEVHHTETESVQYTAPDLVVYTPAVPLSHAGMQYFRKIGVPVVKRAQVLGWLSSLYRCIAVAGTHGKTTTSAMIAFILRTCGIDVTAFLGGIVPSLGGNYIHGSSEWVIAEADEYDRSFHALTPYIAIVTAMDPDHLDIYGSYEDMVDAYGGFIEKLRDGGVLIIHEDVAGRLPEHAMMSVRQRGVQMITYGTNVSDYRIANKNMQYIVYTPDGISHPLTLQMPGLHNAQNATAAIAACVAADCAMDCALSAIGKFAGIRRRFEIVYEDTALTIVDDYAHHPEELRAAIAAARERFPGKRLTGVFQPHLYSRTRDFHRAFAEVLDTLDACVMTELYPAREAPIEGVSSAMIFENMINNNKYLTTKNALIDLLVSLQPEVLLILGAGDLDRMIPEIVQKLKR